MVIEDKLNTVQISPEAEMLIKLFTFVSGRDKASVTKQGLHLSLLIRQAIIDGELPEDFRIKNFRDVLYGDDSNQIVSRTSELAIKAHGNLSKKPDTGLERVKSQ